MDYNVEQSPDMNQQPQHLNTGRPTGKFADKKRLLMIVGVVVGVLLVAGLAWLFLMNKKDSKDTNNQQSNSQTSEENSEPTMPEAEASQLVTYKSTKMNFEVTHRKDWKVKEASDRNQLVLTSPKVTYQTSDGSKQGVFTLKIGLGANDVEQEALDATKIVKDSLLIGYDAPTESQRHYTNVSYAGEEEGVFNFLIVTGSQALKVGSPLGVLIGDGDFLIIGGFGADTNNTLTFDGVDPAAIEQNTGYEQALAIVKSLKVF